VAVGTAGTGRGDPLDAVARLPGVPEAVGAAREACERLRWHPALRRRADACRAEAVVRTVWASAGLEGARLPVAAVRDAARGAQPLPDDPAGRVGSGVLRAVAEAERLAGDGGRVLTRAPRQALARLHTLAAARLVDDDALGRPRRDGEPAADVPAGAPVPPAAEVRARRDGPADALGGPTAAPALVVAAVAHAELLAARPFVAGNGVVARAAARAVVVGRGLDPTGVAVPDAAHLADVDGYAAALAAYRTGGATGVAAWVRHCAEAVVAGAAEGAAVADAVLAGRLRR
jgi:hypothetical protein